MDATQYPPHSFHSVNISKLVTTTMDLNELTPLWLENPPRYVPYQFEAFNPAAFGYFVGNNWYWAFIASVVYVVAIFGLKAYMANRKAFDLRRELFLWNMGLGIFSVIGFSRAFPGLFSVLSSENGFYNSICFPTGANIPELFWVAMFVMSKYIELGDTIFIVLRKKPLVFLQWYHHCVTLLLTWTITPFFEPIMRYYVCMNYAVHSFMYPYFSLKALGVNIPRFISNGITTCQLSQMFIGFFVNGYSAYLFYAGVPCRRFGSSILYSSIVYGSFIILFGKLFVDVIAKSKKIVNKSH